MNLQRSAPPTRYLHTVGRSTEQQLPDFRRIFQTSRPLPIRRESNPFVQPYKQPPLPRVLFIKPLYDFYKFWTMLRKSGITLREFGSMLRNFGIMLRELGSAIRRESNPLVRPYKQPSLSRVLFIKPLCNFQRPLYRRVHIVIFIIRQAPRQYELRYPVNSVPVFFIQPFVIAG